MTGRRWDLSVRFSFGDLWSIFPIFGILFRASRFLVFGPWPSPLGDPRDYFATGTGLPPIGLICHSAFMHVARCSLVAAYLANRARNVAARGSDSTNNLVT